jgi:hypothetical protein
LACEVVRVRKILAVLALGLALAACGGGGGGGSAHYAVDPTANCLASLSGVQVDPDRTNVDYIAQEATGGAVRITASGAEAILSFASDTKQANGIEKQYAGIQEGLGGAKLERKGNVVIAWTDQPSADDDHAVTNCLSA